MAFYDLMFNQCEPAEAIERYAGDVYIQHNPTVAAGDQVGGPVQMAVRLAESLADLGRFDEDDILGRYLELL